jgi:hypothetical protein
MLIKKVNRHAAAKMPLISRNNPELNHRLSGLNIRSNTHFQIRIYTYASIEAYEVLSDPEKSRRYDQLGRNWKGGAEYTPPPGGEGAPVDFGDNYSTELTIFHSGALSNEDEGKEAALPIYTECHK